MNNNGLMRKLRSSHGRIVTNAAGILIFFISVMLVIIAIPHWNRFVYRSEQTACDQAIKSAEDGLIIDFLANWEESTVEQARATLDEVLPERPNICPSNGTVYLIKNDQGLYKPYCGLHCDDLKLRVRLNASRAIELLKDGLWEAKQNDVEDFETIRIELNGRHLDCVRVSEPVELFRGTASTKGFDGTVAFFGLGREGSFKGKKGELVYFLYADENHCALWRKEDDWSGTAYS